LERSGAGLTSVHGLCPASKHEVLLAFSGLGSGQDSSESRACEAIAKATFVYVKLVGRPLLAAAISPPLHYLLHL